MIKVIVFFGVGADEGWPVGAVGLGVGCSVDIALGFGVGCAVGSGYPGTARCAPSHDPSFS